MINYEYKAKILASGLCKDVKKLDRRFKLSIYENIENAVDIPFEEMMFCIEHHCSLGDLNEARRINNATYKRTTRLKERIQGYLLDHECIFLTLEFNDLILSKTSKQTRRKYVARYLKSQTCDYIANIDYGSEREREHYHAIVISHKVNMKLWKYGFIFAERIKNYDKTPVKLAKYVSKLTNHAIKETTRRCSLVYSR